MKTVLTLLALYLVTAVSWAATLRLDVTVIDEEGHPIHGAAVHCETVPRLALDPWNAPARRVSVEAVVDGQGHTQLCGEHALPQLIVGAVAPGFYPAACRVDLTASACQIVLPRRLGSVVAQQLEVVTAVLPEDGSEHGFDLVMGAFIAPLGVGRQADVLLSGRCPSARLRPGASGAFSDRAQLRFTNPSDGLRAIPRPDQKGFAAAVAPACADMALPGLESVRRAPDDGYMPTLLYRLSRGAAPTDIPFPGRSGAPQWIFRIHRDGLPVYGVLSDFGWLPDGRLRLFYRISTEPGNPSLEFTH